MSERDSKGLRCSGHRATSELLSFPVFIHLWPLPPTHPLPPLPITWSLCLGKALTFCSVAFSVVVGFGLGFFSWRLGHFKIISLLKMTINFTLPCCKTGQCCHYSAPSGGFMAPCLMWCNPLKWKIIATEPLTQRDDLRGTGIIKAAPYKPSTKALLRAASTLSE